jgi:hypothetical protein
MPFRYASLESTTMVTAKISHYYPAFCERLTDVRRWSYARLELLSHDGVGDHVHAFPELVVTLEELSAKYCIFAPGEGSITRQSPLYATHPVCDTQITASTFFSVPTISLFVKMLAASSKPNRLWSVKTVRIPIRWACRIPSCPMDDKLACAWISWMRSRRNIVRR